MRAFTKAAFTQHVPSQSHPQPSCNSHVSPAHLWPMLIWLGWIMVMCGGILWVWGDALLLPFQGIVNWLGSFDVVMRERGLVGKTWQRRLTSPNLFFPFFFFFYLNYNRSVLAKLSRSGAKTLTPGKVWEKKWYWSSDMLILALIDTCSIFNLLKFRKMWYCFFFSSPNVMKHIDLWISWSSCTKPTISKQMQIKKTIDKKKNTQFFDF